MENPFQNEWCRRQRPVFLSVLCILTFIGSGSVILSNLFMIFVADLMNGGIVMEQYASSVGGVEGVEIPALWQDYVRVMQVMAVHSRDIAVMRLVLGIVSLSGAVLMFRLRRSGFYLYVAAQILMFFIYPYFAGFSVVVGLFMCWSVFISIIFIGMYAANLRYMK